MKELLLPETLEVLCNELDQSGQDGSDKEDYASICDAVMKMELNFEAGPLDANLGMFLRSFYNLANKIDKTLITDVLTENMLALFDKALRLFDLQEEQADYFKYTNFFFNTPVQEYISDLLHCLENNGTIRKGYALRFDKNIAQLHVDVFATDGYSLEYAFNWALNRPDEFDLSYLKKLYSKWNACRNIEYCNGKMVRVYNGKFNKDETEFPDEIKLKHAVFSGTRNHAIAYYTTALEFDCYFRLSDTKRNAKDSLNSFNVAERIVRDAQLSPHPEVRALGQELFEMIYNKFYKYCVTSDAKKDELEGMKRTLEIAEGTDLIKSKLGQDLCGKVFSLMLQHTEDVEKKSELDLGNAYLEAVHYAELLGTALGIDNTEIVKELYTKASYAYEKEAFNTHLRNKLKVKITNDGSSNCRRGVVQPGYQTKSYDEVGKLVEIITIPPGHYTYLDTDMLKESIRKCMKSNINELLFSAITCAQKAGLEERVELLTHIYISQPLII